MGQVDAALDMTGELSARVIRRDGSVEDLGVISTETWPVLPRQRKRSALRFWLLLLLGAALGIFALLVLSAVTRSVWLSIVLFLPVFGLVTNAGVAYMAADFAGGGSSPHIGALNFQDSGTGTTAAAVTDTTLGTATGNARIAGTQSQPGTTNIYRSVATLSYAAGFAITEWGIFSALTTGTLWDRRVFSAINVVSGDSIQFTYNLQINSGGT